MTQEAALAASFRDPAGHLFEIDGQIYRQINARYFEHYRALMDSGLYASLTQSGRLIPHEERPDMAPDAATLIIEPEQIGYISYPYEWCFSQLKDAALLTLDIQQTAIEHGLSLKDASAFNVQFHGGRATFIDTLSFETLDPTRPWVAYRQFCQHFLGPLALMSYADPRARKLMLGFIDGIPLDLSARLLPGRSRLRYSLLAHIHLHARAQERHADAAQLATADSQPTPMSSKPMSKDLLTALISSLRNAIEKCALPGSLATEWGEYYEATNYSLDSMTNKETLVAQQLQKHTPSNGTVHDLGANTGRFSRIASQHANLVVSHDIDELAVEQNYLALRAANQHAKSAGSLLPLVLDLTNPTPAIGWHNEERSAFKERCRADTLLALALIHHLAISNNTPLAKIAASFAELTEVLIIEFVPKGDSQVDRLLATREDIFNQYDQVNFEAAFAEHFDLLEQHPVEGSQRVLYSFKAKRPTGAAS